MQAKDMLWQHERAVPSASLLVACDIHAPLLTSVLATHISIPVRRKMKLKKQKIKKEQALTLCYALLGLYNSACCYTWPSPPILPAACSLLQKLQTNSRRAGSAA
jgi:hypothetical protein